MPQLSANRARGVVDSDFCRIGVSKLRHPSWVVARDIKIALHFCYGE